MSEPTSLGTSDRRVLPLLVPVAALLWLHNFAIGWLPFWVSMGASVALLMTLSFALDGAQLRQQLGFRVMDPVLGVASAGILYGAFFIGDRLSAVLFSFAPGQVGTIYDLASGHSKLAVAALLILVMGPGEEIFWRGVVQNRLARRHGTVWGYVLATLIYAAVHLPSGNFMLVMAALVAGAFWGLMYARLGRLWPLIISHALWDVAAFLIWPIR